MRLIKSIKCYSKHLLYRVIFIYHFAQKVFIELFKKKKKKVTGNKGKLDNTCKYFWERGWHKSTLRPINSLPVSYHRNGRPFIFLPLTTLRGRHSCHPLNTQTDLFSSISTLLHS